MSARRQHTFIIVVSAPAGLRKAQVAREVRTLVNESTVFGAAYQPAGRPGDVEYVDHGDIKVRKIERVYAFGERSS